jgi:hypothetical protein
MIAFSQVAASPRQPDPASISDTGYSALIALLLLMSLPGIVGPLLMRRQLIV